MPFTGSEPKEIVRKIRAGQYKPLQEIVAIPEQLARLVARLLSPHSEDRPQAGLEVATQLTEIARQYGIESSGPSIAALLKQVFPDEHSSTAEQSAIAMNDVVRVLSEDADVPKEKSPVSVTPGSPSGKRLSPIDVSETYRVPVGARPISDELPPLSRPVSPGSDELPPLTRPAVWPGSAPVQVTRRAPEPVPNLREGSLVKIAIVALVVIVLALLVYRDWS
jgi:hypothetical protein